MKSITSLYKEGQKGDFLMEKVSWVDQKILERLNDLLRNEKYPSSVDLLVVNQSGRLMAERLRYSKVEEALEGTLTLMSACDSIAKSFVQGDATECIIHGTKGYVVAVEAGSAVLIAAGIPASQLGLMLQKLRGTAKKIKELLGS